jgi:hypothetical protein
MGDNTDRLMNKLVRFSKNDVDEMTVISRLKGESATAVIREYVRRGLATDRERIRNAQRLTEAEITERTAV